MTPQDIIRKYDMLESDRAAKDEVIDLVDRFVTPGRGQLYTETTDENSIDWKHRELYDETAGLAAQTLAASIHGAMTSPAIKWFQFAFRDKQLNDDPRASEWLGMVRDTVYTDLMDSNFNTEVIETYLSDVTYGDAVLGHSIDIVGKDYFRNQNVKGTYYDMDFLDNACGLYVKREYTVDQLIGEFGAVPETLAEIASQNPGRAATEKHEVIHAIYKEKANAEADTSKVLTPSARPYQEAFILVEGAHKLNTDPEGYYEFPAYVLRWGRVAGSKYSYSPAINCLGTILSLNQLVEVILSQAEKVVDPPILTMDRGVIGDVDLRAGGQTVVRDISAIKEFISQGRFDVSNLQRQQLIESIRSAFYIDQLELKDSPAMTATEANIRYELMQRLLGPSLTRIRIDLLDRLLERKFYAVVRQGRVPPAPDIVLEKGASYDVEYIGPWSRAQKSDSVMAMEQSLMYVAQLAGSVNMPELLDNFELDALMRQIALERGMAPKFIKDEKKLEAERQMRAQAAQEQQALAAQESQAKAAKDMGAAEASMAKAQVPQQ